MKANSFLLSVCSPVLHKMICGSFNESGGREMEVKDVDGAAGCVPQSAGLVVREGA